MSWKATAFVTAAAFLIFAVVDVLAFRTGLYRAMLDPSSSTGSFETAIAQFRDLPPNPKRDVLVLGDSRIYSGLDPAAADSAAGNLRFLNGGVPGTTPRCWPFFVRAIDPDAGRFRAVVIAVDTYADDDSAIGSLDGNDRPMDLRYVVLQTRLSDLPKLAGSFSDPRERVENGIDLFWRGQELRDDVQAFAADPAARFAAINGARRTPAYDPLAAHPRSESLAGLHVDFSTNAITYPNGIPDDQRNAIATQVLTVAKPSPSYARYRTQWLAPLAARYEAAGVPVIFVRIPTRPTHRSPNQLPSGSIVTIVHDEQAHLIPAAAYIALERPDLFADEDHLNREGSRRFSRLLGTDVAHILADRSPPAVAPAAAGAAVTSAPAKPQPPERHSLSWFAAACGIGIPLRFTSYEFWLFFLIVALLFYLLPRRA
ncbi:MAG: hypothetical protein WAK16_03370, partial [Candidatus Cybelea sp.]